MLSESQLRENLNFTDVEKLSESIKPPYNETLRGELGFSRYRMDYILKKYAELSDDFKIHALFEHGIIYTNYAGGAFRAHEYLPSIVPSKFRVNVLKKQKYNNGAYAIGPYIHYTNSLLDENSFKEEKERLGKTLLVFPSHSIKGLISNFNFEEFIDNIKVISEDFDSVRICMYYQDVTLKRHIPYLKEGFEVVTAGHVNDCNFLPRLKSIIQTADMTMSNGIVGSHLGYCIYLDKPHFLINSNDVNYRNENEDRNSKLMYQNLEIAKKYFNEDKNLEIITEIFSNYSEKITSEQKKIIGYLWGFNEVKTPNELKKIFLEINERYSPIKYYLSGLTRLKDIIKGKR